MPREKLRAFRLGEAHDAMLDAIVAETRRSFTESLRVAIEREYRRIVGRRGADRVPVRRRPDAEKKS